MNKKFRNILIALVAALVIGSCVFMFIISPIKVKTGNREMPDANNQTEEILSGIVIEENFKNYTEDINEIAVVFSRAYDLGEHTDIVIELLNGVDILASESIDADSIEANHRTYLRPSSVLSGLVGKELTLKIYTTSTAGTGLSLMINTDEDSSFTYGNKTLKGTICFSVTGKE